jgi:hypothetical protein
MNHGHATPAYGYRIDNGAHAVVLSGDTTYAPNVIRHTQGVDLLIHCVAIGSRRLEAAAPAFVQHFYEYLNQWSGQKSGSDSAVSSEFVIAGMIFHPSRVKSSLLHT